MMTWFGNQPETVVGRTECLPTYRATWRPSPAPGGGPSSFWSGRSRLRARPWPSCVPVAFLRAWGLRAWDVPVVLEMGSDSTVGPRGWVLAPPQPSALCLRTGPVNVLARGGVMVCMVLLLLLLAKEGRARGGDGDGSDLFPSWPPFGKLVRRHQVYPSLFSLRPPPARLSLRLINVRP